VRVTLEILTRLSKDERAQVHGFVGNQGVEREGLRWVRKCFERWQILILTLLMRSSLAQMILMTTFESQMYAHCVHEETNVCAPEVREPETCKSEPLRHTFIIGESEK